MSGPYSLEDFLGFWPTLIIAILLGLVAIAGMCGLGWLAWWLFKVLVHAAMVA